MVPSALVVLLVGALLGQCRLGVVVSIYGAWSAWTAWTTCTASCNGGMSMRDRSCSNPPPGPQGADCVGATQEFKKCNTRPCPSATVGRWSPGSPDHVGLCIPCIYPHTANDGRWSPWNPWYGCTVSCGSGVKLRVRKCDNPRPDPNGENCVGDPLQTSVCNTQQCPIEVDGGWSGWNPWYGCTVSCGGGVRLRERECDNPSPGPGGRFCMGKSHESSACNTQACLIAGAPFVAFSVLLNRDYKSKHGSIIPFDTPAYNGTDNHYNFTDHLFHAPVNGKYFFSFDASSYFHKTDIDIRLIIRKPGENIPIRGRALRLGSSNKKHNDVRSWPIWAHAHGPPLNNAAASAIREMRKGDMAMLWLCGELEVGLIHFSGMLIHQTY